MSRLGLNCSLLVYNSVISQMIASDNMESSNIDYDLLNDLGFEFDWSEEWDEDWDEDWEDLDYLHQESEKENETTISPQPKIDIEAEFEQERVVDYIMENLKNGESESDRKRRFG